MQIKNAVCYSLTLHQQDALAHLRLIGPFQQAGINITNGIVESRPVCDYAARGDVVVIQRDFPGNFKAYQKIVEIARQNEKPIVFELDDLLFFLPENHIARPSFAPSLLPMFQALEDANMVTVSTPRLKSVLDHYHDHVVVLPNYFDDALWQLKPPVANKEQRDEILTIGYVGGNTHYADLGYIVPIFLELIKRYPHKIRFHFWGAEPPQSIRSLTLVTRTTDYYPSYKDFVTFFQSQSADIFIAPLLDNLFNRCKSSIKFFDCTALGVPGVFSRLEPYTQVVAHGENGLLAESLDEWLDCLVQLIENPELRLQLATNAQETIRSSWLLSKNAFRWRESFDNLVKPSFNERGQNEANILQSINIQLSDAFSIKEQQTKGVMASRAWRLAVFLQRLRAKLVPHGSWRARMIKKIYSLLRFPFAHHFSS